MDTSSNTDNKINLKGENEIRKESKCDNSESKVENYTEQTNINDVIIKYIQGKIFSKSKRFNPDNYVSLLEIGRGNYSSIYLVEDKNTKLLCAMKIYLKMRVENLRKKGEVLMEKHALEKISPHKYIINFLGSNKDEVIFI